MARDIHWFPGHMNKALNELKKKISLVDVVIELFDARAPFSSINENLASITKDKKKLILLTKIDLADPAQTSLWINKLAKEYDSVIGIDLTSNKAWKLISDEINKLGEEKRNKDLKRGIKPQPIRAMIIGIPNVGKSSLINRVAKRRAAGVENKPGFTRGEQWIKVNKDFLLLDTPGILPMSYENKNKSANLALIGSIREDILPNDILVNYLLDFFRKRYPSALKKRFNLSIELENIDIMTSIAKQRGLLSSKEIDLSRSEALLLKEFKDGKLGRMTLEWVE